MVITKKLLSAGCAAALAASMCAPAIAMAETLTPDEKGFASSNPVQMKIDIKASTVDITVPAVPGVDPTNPPTDPDDPNYEAWYNATTLVFNEDGTVTSANLPIQNNSITDITLASVSVKASDGWTLHNWGDNSVDYGTMKDEKEFALSVGGVGATGDTVKTATLNKLIKGGKSDTIAFDATGHRGAFSANQVGIHNAFEATLNFDLDLATTA